MIRIGLYTEDRTLQPLLSSALGKEFQVLLESDRDEIIHRLSAGGCDVMILDLNSNRDSLRQRVADARRMIESEVSWVVMADGALRSTAVELVRLGAYGYCRRPPSIRDLEVMLRRAHESCSLKRELQSAQQLLKAPSNCDGMIGSSPQMGHVYDLVRRVASLNASVLVTGESGTGKEL